jgi:hypothetical protein
MTIVNLENAELQRRKTVALELLANSAHRFVLLLERVEKMVLAEIEEGKKRGRW